MARIRQFLLHNAVLALLAFAVLFGWALYLLLRPLFHAADRAERMTLGSLPLEPLPVTRHDEVGHLITAFNRLLSKLDQQQAELRRLAHHDALTGLPNRTLLADRLAQAVAHARRHQTQLALLFLDLDGFKPVNDAFGHKSGDGVLQQVAERLRQVVRGIDTVARFGGDEFVVLLTELAPPTANAVAAAEGVAQKLIDALSAPFTVATGGQCQLGVSIGIALGDGNATPAALILAADQAMYHAKDAGRGHFAWAS